jgi:hypothetical protein
MVAPQSQPGNAASALQKINSAAKLINDALPDVPLGTDFHNDLLKLATQINKIISNAPAQPGPQATQLSQLARQVAQQAPAQALARMYPQPSAPAMAAVPAQAGAQPGAAA